MTTTARPNLIRTMTSLTQQYMHQPESNPGHIDSNDVFYHSTTDACAPAPRPPTRLRTCPTAPQHRCTAGPHLQMQHQNRMLASRCGYVAQLIALSTYGLPHQHTKTRTTIPHWLRITINAKPSAATMPHKPSAQPTRKTQTPTQQTNINNNAPREARTPDLEVNGLTP